MIFKLSYQNIKKNFKEYSIYFITMTLSVALCYIFNLLEYQPFMKEFTTHASEDLTTMLSNLSVPISLIVTGLALYSNRFILKRRSRELSIYLILGTRYSKVHLMIIMENFLVTCISFVCGCLFGILTTRIFDLLINNLLGLIITENTIFFTPTAFTKTLLIFLNIFVLIAIFNYFIISRVKLLDLVKSDGEVLQIPKRSMPTGITAVLLILSVIFAGIFYRTLLIPSINFYDTQTMVKVSLGFLGHMGIFLFGTSVLSKLLAINKNYLYNGMNLFSIRKFVQKVEQNGFILGIISFVMTITLIVLNLGFSSHIWIKENLKYTAPYSISVSGIQNNVPLDKVTEYISEQGYTIKKSISFPLYHTDYILSDFLPSYELEKLSVEYQHSQMSNIRLMMISDYNNIREFAGYKPVSISEGNYVIHEDNGIAPAQYTCPNIIIKTHTLTNHDNRIYSEPLNDSRGVMGYGITIVINDKNYSVSQKDFFNISLLVNVLEEKTDKLLHSINDHESGLYGFISQYNGGHQVVLRSDKYNYNLKQASTVIFAGLFIGMILLITGASILSLHQLTDIISSKKYYHIIQKLGVRKSSISSSIFKQIFLYFTFPLIIAICHSIFGTIAMTSYTHMAIDSSSFVLSTVVSSLLFMIIYVIYILYTHERCKKILNM